MLATTSPRPPFEVSFTDADSLLIDRWLAPATPDQLSNHYADLLVMARHYHHCRFWLLDLRQYDWGTPALGTWLAHTFARHATQVLGCPLFIAYLLDPVHYDKAAAAASSSLLRQCADYQMYPYFFASEKAATEWLHHQQELDVTYCARQLA
jgi:hypothetical protein